MGMAPRFVRPLEPRPRTARTWRKTVGYVPSIRSAVMMTKTLVANSLGLSSNSWDPSRPPIVESTTRTGRPPGRPAERAVPLPLVPDRSRPLSRTYAFDPHLHATIEHPANTRSTNITTTSLRPNTLLPESRRCRYQLSAVKGSRITLRGRPAREGGRDLGAVVRRTGPNRLVPCRFGTPLVERRFLAKGGDSGRRVAPLTVEP